MNVGKLLIIIGAAIVMIGFVVYFLGDKLSWFGRLPGDIRIEKENGIFYFPITTMLLLSLVLNVILWAIKKYLY